MISEIEQHRQELEALCHEYGVERLALFGSVATGGFRLNSSDIDFLVEFRTPLTSGAMPTDILGCLKACRRSSNGRLIWL